MRARGLVAAVLLAGAAGAAPAGAALKFERPCGESNFECARVPVPLDRSGAVPGVVKLYVERSRHATRPAGAVFALAGGPGQGATTLTESFNRDLSTSIGQRDLIVFDQRGTGKSGVLDCAALEQPDDRPIDERTADCARDLGARRSLYTTRESVEDLEAVRAALGIDRITLFGVSYGTKVALAYAMAHPEHVERLVLDSVVDPFARDPFALASLAALPRVLDEVCRGECADITPSLSGAVSDLGDMLAAGPLGAPFVDGRGRRSTKTVSARALYGIIRAADLDPTARSEYPGAVAAAVAGDPAPLVRLEHRYDDLPPLPGPPDPTAVQSLSFTLQAATLCEEEALPWERTASPEERDRQARESAAAIPDARFEPFDRSTMLVPDSNNLIFQCRLWPAAPVAPALVGDGLPDVPVLVLSGLEDTRTSLETGTQVAARFPRASLVAVPKTAHAVVGRRPCARAAVARFFADRPIGTPCSRARGGMRLRPVPPAGLADVAPYSGVPGARGRALRAVILTIEDLRREHSARIFPPIRGGGLRAGRFAQRGKTVEVHGFSFVEGLSITGRLVPPAMAGTLRVRGASAATSGTLRVGPRGALTGTLGGRAVRACTTARCAPAAAPARRR